MDSINITSKIKANAVSAYLLLFISFLFLFNKDNKHLNNKFVKSHTKIALIIHLWFLITYIIFTTYWTGLNFQILNYSINDIISISIFLILFLLILIWIYKANSWKTFNFTEAINIWNKEKKDIFTTKNDLNIKEKDKLTIILSRIPFIGFIIASKYKNNKIIENNQKLNLIITFIIIFLYVYWNYNLANLLFLVYIIFLVFLWINTFQNNIIYFNLEKIPSIKKLYLYSISFIIYMKNYFWKKHFKTFNEVYINIDKINDTKEKILEKQLQNQTSFKLINILVYIPIINIISIFNINSKLKIHIINWLIITWLFILSWITLWFNNKQQLFLLFPIAFWIWNINYLSYKLAFLYDIYNIIAIITWRFLNIFSFLNKKHKEEKFFSSKI